MKNSEKKIPNQELNGQLNRNKAATSRGNRPIPNQEENEQLNRHKTGTSRDHRPSMQQGDSPVQNPNRNLPKGGNPVGRGSGPHNSVSGGKSLQGNNARSKPASDKTHN